MQSHRCSRLLIVVLALAAVGCSARAQEKKYRVFFGQTASALLPGYELPPESAYGPLWGLVESRVWQTRDGSGQAKAEFWTSGDFNGDGLVDYAYILIRTESRQRALYTILSSPSGYSPVLVAADIPERMGLATRGAGRYETAAARGIGPDAPSAVLAFDVRYQAIDFFQFEGGASTFVWNESAEEFERYWTSD